MSSHRVCHWSGPLVGALIQGNQILVLAFQYLTQDGFIGFDHGCLLIQYFLRGRTGPDLGADTSNTKLSREVGVLAARMEVRIVATHRGATVGKARLTNWPGGG